MSLQTRRMLASAGILCLCAMLVGAVSRRHPAQAAPEAVFIGGTASPAPLSEVGLPVDTEADQPIVSVPLSRPKVFVTPAATYVMDKDGTPAKLVDLGQLAPLLSAKTLADPVVMVLPTIHHGATVVFHATPPPGENWRVEWWYEDAAGLGKMDHYTISRTSAREELTLPVMRIQPREAFQAKIDPLRVDDAVQLVIKLQRVGAPGDPHHGPDDAIGPETQWYVPIAPAISPYH